MYIVLYHKDIATICDSSFISLMFARRGGLYYIYDYLKRHNYTIKLMCLQYILQINSQPQLFVFVFFKFTWRRAFLYRLVQCSRDAEYKFKTS